MIEPEDGKRISIEVNNSNDNDNIRIPKTMFAV
jgi:hypothetical protein